MDIDLHLHSVKGSNIKYNAILIDNDISYLVRLRSGSNLSNYIVDFISKPTVVCCDMSLDGTCSWYISEIGLDKLLMEI